MIALALAWWSHAVCYEVFVRSFADSDGDGVGDFRGVSEHLDDLQALGVDALWLMPIYPSPSYHGYDVTDFTAVNPDYGTLADFDALVAAAHARKMRVILDFVPNHTSDQHPWFANRDWYVWKSAPDERWKRPWDGADVWREEQRGYYLGLFTRRMPDLNLSNPDVVHALEAAMKFWLRRGVDGFRLDAVRHLVEVEHGDTVEMVDTSATHAVLREFRRAMPNALFVAEAWTDAKTIATYTREMQLAFDFPLAAGIVDAVRDDDKMPFVEALDVANDAFADPSSEAQFITNHDQQRAMRDFGGDVSKAKLAEALLFALPGTPFLYYGEEIGMQGGAARPDENKRTPMQWTRTDATARAWFRAGEREADGVDVADERSDAQSLWSAVRALIALRHSEPALTSSAKLVRANIDGGDRGTLALVRDDGAAGARHRRILFVASFDTDESAPFDVDVAGRVSVLLATGVHGEIHRASSGVRIPPLAPHGFAFVALDSTP